MQILGCAVLFATLVAESATLLPQLQHMLVEELLVSPHTVQPALSGDSSRSQEERLRQVAEGIAKEVNLTLKRFAASKPPRIFDPVKETLREIDAEIPRDGLAIEYRDGLVLQRQVALIEFPAWQVGQNLAKRVMDVVTSFERTLQPGEIVEEYPSSDHVREAERFEGQTDKRPPLLPYQPLRIKKCRDYDDITVGGWTCLTSLYENRPSKDLEKTELLVRVSLNAQTSRPPFAQVLAPHGLTSVWAIKQNGYHVFMYHINVLSARSGLRDERDLLKKTFLREHEALRAHLREMMPATDVEYPI